MLYLIPHRYLPWYNWHRYCHAVFDTDIFHAIFDTCHAICDMWHLILILAMLYMTCDTRPRYLSCYTYHLILDTDSWYVILDTCSWHTVYDMLSCGTNTWTWHYDSWPDTTIPDTCGIFMATTFTGTWLLFYYHIFGTPGLLYSCILDPLK